MEKILQSPVLMLIYLLPLLLTILVILFCFYELNRPARTESDHLSPNNSLKQDSFPRNSPTTDHALIPRAQRKKEFYLFSFKDLYQTMVDNLPQDFSQIYKDTASRQLFEQAEEILHYKIQKMFDNFPSQIATFNSLCRSFSRDDDFWVMFWTVHCRSITYEWNIFVYLRLYYRDRSFPAVCQRPTYQVIGEIIQKMQSHLLALTDTSPEANTAKTNLESHLQRFQEYLVTYSKPVTNFEFLKEESELSD